VRILSPRKLDEALLSDEIATIIVLDTVFTKEHPRSQKRIEFVKQYADKCEIPFIMGSYQDIIEAYIAQ